MNTLISVSIAAISFSSFSNRLLKSVYVLVDI